MEGGRGEDQEGGGGTGPWTEGGKDQEGWRARTDRRSRGGDRRDSQQHLSCPNRKSLVKSKAPRLSPAPCARPVRGKSSLRVGGLFGGLGSETRERALELTHLHKG